MNLYLSNEMVYDVLSLSKYEYENKNNRRTEKESCFNNQAHKTMIV